MRVHVVQVAYGDAETVPQRVERVASLVGRQHGADLVVLPELWAPGGFSYRQWSEYAEPVEGPTVRAVADAAREIGAVVHAGSIIEQVPDGAPDEARGETGRGLWNTSVVVGSDGAVLATYRKIHRFGFGEGEPALLEAGTAVVVTSLPATTGPVPVGLATCYDLRFPEQFRLLVDAGAHMVVVPAAWPAARRDHWLLLGRARAVENQCVVIQCNTAGTHSSVAMAGHSQVVSARGEVLAEAGDDEEVLVVEVDLGDVQVWRDRFPVLADRRL
jgi:predicted amidohydrolase